MRHRIIKPVAIVGTVLGAALVLNQGIAGGEPTDVDESTLVPPLFPGYDWSCHSTTSGATCRGHLPVDTGWERGEDLCSVPVFVSASGDRYSTRYYNTDHKLETKIGRVHETESFSSSSGGPAWVTLATHSRYTTDYDLAGEEGTGTQVSKGTHWEMRALGGKLIFRVVGTLVEPYDAEPTFTGQVTRDGQTERVVDAPLSAVVEDEWFLGQICDWVQSSGGTTPIPPGVPR